MYLVKQNLVVPIRRVINMGVECGALAPVALPLTNGNLFYTWKNH